MFSATAFSYAKGGRDSNAPTALSDARAEHARCSDGHLESQTLSRASDHVAIHLLYRIAVTRAAPSLGVGDLVGVGSTDFALVQVKTRDWPG